MGSNIAAPTEASRQIEGPESVEQWQIMQQSQQNTDTEEHPDTSADYGAVEKLLDKIIDKFPCEAEKGEATPDAIAYKNPDQPEIDPNSCMQEVPVFVPKVVVHELVKEVPKYEIEWFERVVEVPQIEYVDKYKTVPQVQYVPKRVPRIEVVEVPREIIKKVPVIETKNVEKIIKVPSGEKIPVAKISPTTTEIIAPRFYDRRVPVVLSRQIQVEITETDQDYEVDVARYVPYLVPVDVFVPKPISVPMVDMGICRQIEQEAVQDPILLQQLTIQMNPHLQLLEEFNCHQERLFQESILKSQAQAAFHGLDAPPPIVLPVAPMAHKSRTSHIAGDSISTHHSSGQCNSPIVNCGSAKLSRPWPTSRLGSLSRSAISTPHELPPTKA